MKNLSLFVSAFALCASTSYAAINCGTLPNCSDLGYTDKVAECPSSSEVLKCPFDTAYGKCTRGPSIGDLKYSLNSHDHDGWLKCDGRQFSSDSTAKYYKLFREIGTNFCHKYTSKTDTSYTTSNCDAGKFAVPDYRGFFLRAATSKDSVASISGNTTYSTAFGFMGGDENSNLYLPQYERLPNITGEGGWYENTENKNFTSIKTRLKGAFYAVKDGSGVFGNDGTDKDNAMLNFDASKTEGTGKGVYQEGAHVIPANYAANIFIYAGR